MNIVRIFEDNNFVFAHTEYDFSTRNIGFEIFRFNNGQAIEHWDNIQKRLGPNIAGHTMVDGETEATDHKMTESNRTLVQSFIEDVLIHGHLEEIDACINREHYTEHNPHFGDDLVDLCAILSKSFLDDYSFQYEKCHRLLADGNFVLSVCEGYTGHNQSSFFDLYRLQGGKIVEHWDTTEIIPPRSEWKNNNGKF